MPTGIPNNRCCELKVMLGIKSRIAGTEQKRKEDLSLSLRCLQMWWKEAEVCHRNMLHQMCLRNGLSWIDMSTLSPLNTKSFFFFFSTKMFTVLYFAYSENSRRKPFLLETDVVSHLQHKESSGAAGAEGITREGCSSHSSSPNSAGTLWNGPVSASQTTHHLLSSIAENHSGKHFAASQGGNSANKQESTRLV